MTVLHCCIVNERCDALNELSGDIPTNFDGTSPRFQKPYSFFPTPYPVEIRAFFSHRLLRVVIIFLVKRKRLRISSSFTVGRTFFFTFSVRHH